MRRVLCTCFLVTFEGQSLTVSLSFGFVLFVFLLIGLFSRSRAKANSEDYYLAGRAISPLMVGLSAAASWCSGFMFIGQIGFTYNRGLSSIWIMLGLILGDLFVASLAFRRFRVQTEKHNQQSYFEGLFDSASENQSLIERVLLWFVCAVALVALVGYSAAQILASGKAFEAVYALPIEVGAVLTAVIIAMYCFSGGIRASIWTDVAQAVTMLLAISILFVQSLLFVGGPHSFIDALAGMPADFISFYPPDIIHQSPLFLFLIFLGWFGGGVGVGGQPHVIVRFMALNSGKEMNRALGYYYGYYIALYALAILIGLSSRIIMPDLINGDSELALPMLAKELLPDFLIGAILAGLFASTMSTADSLVLSASALVTRDLFPGLSEKYGAMKMFTLLILASALGLVLSSASGVFKKVIIFGGMLSASFAPIMLLRMLQMQLPLQVMAWMAIAGFFATSIWRELGYSYIIYQVAVGIAVGLVVGLLYKFFRWARKDKSERVRN